MIVLKDALALAKMRTAGALLAEMFDGMSVVVKEGASTASIDVWIAQWLSLHGLISKTKGYQGYRHVSCVSVNDEVVHGIPRSLKLLVPGDLVKVDVCASWSGYSAH